MKKHQIMDFKLACLLPGKLFCQWCCSGPITNGFAINRFASIHQWSWTRKMQQTVRSMWQWNLVARNWILCSKPTWLSWLCRQKCHCATNLNECCKRKQLGIVIKTSMCLPCQHRNGMFAQSQIIWSGSEIEITIILLIKVIPSPICPLALGALCSQMHARPCFWQCTRCLKQVLVWQMSRSSCTF